MDKPRLARQTVLGALLAAAALLGTVVAAPARAAAAVPQGWHHHRHGHHGRSHADTLQAGAGLPALHVVTALGFDTCWAPPVSAMQAWHDDSAYRAVGIYIGGGNRACVGGNLTPSWVSTVAKQGWSFVPIYVGRQAPCVLQTGVAKMQPAQAAQEAIAEADDAAAQARAYGLAEGSPVYFDLEAFTQTDRGCVGTVLTYLNAWTRELHAAGYYSGVYGSASSGMTMLAEAVQSQPSFTPPEAIWIARWDLKPETADGSVPDGLWYGRQRLKQYQGGHVETHGGVSITIDSDYLDGPVARVQ